MTTQTKDFDLNKHTARLLLDEPFLTAISRRINKRASYGIPTAGVLVNKDTAQFEMLYNPGYFASLCDGECKAVLMHEFYHIIMKHVTERAPWNKEGDETGAKLWNIATDLAINSHIENLPSGALMPGQDMFKDLPKGKAAEWYAKQVQDIINNGGQPDESKTDESKTDDQGDDSEQQSGGSPGEVNTLDDHSGWGTCPQEVADIANQRLREIVADAAQEAATQGWGSLSGSLRTDIMATLSTKVDWRKVLRYFVKASQRADRKNTIRRINRRYPYIHAGKKSARQSNVAISIDQSGSVSDDLLAMFFAELNKLSDIASFTVVPFDTVVDESKVYVWKKGQSRNVERVLNGGTCFDAPTEYVNKRSFDAHIILTDMGAPKPRPSKCQRMWMTTKHYLNNSYFDTNERVVAVD